MTSRLTAAVLALLLAAAGACFAADHATLPPAPRAPDCFPQSWLQFPVEWKPTWDETLAANYDPAAWAKAFSQDEDLKEVAERVASVRHIALLEAMTARFTADKGKHADACREISREYMALGDRARAVQWLRKMADDSGRPDIVAEACAGILRHAHPFEAMPDSRSWVAYAAGRIEALLKAGSIPADNPAVDLARRQTLLVLRADSRYADMRRFLDSLPGAEASRPEWCSERAALLERAGHPLPAADVYDKAGNDKYAASLRERFRPPVGGEVLSRPPAELAAAWEELNGKAKLLGKQALTDGSRVAKLLRLSVTSDALTPCEDSRQVSFWVNVDVLLRGFAREDLGPLREYQERTAAGMIDELRRTGDRDRMMWLLRRAPWAQSTQLLLAEMGEAALRDGRPQWACRAFRDVLARADDQGIIGQARAGLWLAMAALQEEGVEVERSMAEVPDNAEIPWRGVAARAVDVKQAVRGMVRRAAAPTALSALRSRGICFPAAFAGDETVSQGFPPAEGGLSPWAVRGVEATGDSIFVLGHRRVACFAAAQSSLRWVSDRTTALGAPDDETAHGDGERARRAAARTRRPVVLGNSRSTAVAERRVGASNAAGPARALFTLVCNADDDVTSFDLRAFDAATGRTLWTTGRRAEWADMQPLNDPVAAEGCVYVLASGRDPRKPSPIHMLCLDGEDGSVLWRRQLALPLDNGQLQELAMCGGAVTIHEGSVYASCNRGVIARCDTRDGMVEWLRTYRPAVQGERLDMQFRREGSPPLVAGGKVLVAPRDHSGVMALDTETGALAWESLLVPSDRILGVADGRHVVVEGEGQLAALSLETGREAWVREAEDGNWTDAVLAGQEVVAGEGRRLVRLAAATGAVIEQAPLAAGPGAGRVLLPDMTLLEVREEAAANPAAERAAAARPLRLPMAQSWSMRCEKPLLVMPGAQGPGKSLGVLSGRLLFCVRTDPDCRAVWQTRLSDRPDSLGFHGDMLLAARGGEITAIDSATGAVRWSRRLPFRAELVGGDDKVVYACELADGGKAVALRAGNGEVLWQRWFGQEAALAGGRLKWAALEAAAEPSLTLWWDSAFLGRQGRRPAVLTLEAMPGRVAGIRRFLPDEPEWPSQIAFGGDTRAYVRQSPLQSWARHGPFMPDMIAYAARDSIARFVERREERDLAPAWRREADRPSSGPDIAGLHATAAGYYMKRPGELILYEAATNRETAFQLPTVPGAASKRVILTFGESGQTLIVISGVMPPPAATGKHAFAQFGLRDNNGCGNTALFWFGPGAQVGHAKRGFPEAGSNPVATLLNGTTKEHYRPTSMTMSGLSSLGWLKYDVYLYGFNGTATINGGDAQTCKGMDYSKKEHRTTFIRGVNYVKFAGVSGDTFTMDIEQTDFAALQVVDASPQAGAKRSSIGMNWTGGGPALQPGDSVGAEVQASNWYNMSYYNKPFGGPQVASNNVADVLVDVFDRATGAVAGSQRLEGIRATVSSSDLGTDARFLGDDALVVTDAEGVHVYRAAP